MPPGAVGRRAVTRAREGHRDRRRPRPAVHRPDMGVEPVNLEQSARCVEPPEFRAEGTQLTRRCRDALRRQVQADRRPVPGGVQRPARSRRRSASRTSAPTTSTAAPTWPAPATARCGSPTTAANSPTRSTCPTRPPAATPPHLLERGDIKGSSIGFRALPKAVAWSVDEDGMALRSVSEAQLFRVDLTVAPYYPTRPPSSPCVPSPTTRAWSSVPFWRPPTEASFPP
jgi:hypothetical protein